MKRSRCALGATSLLLAVLAAIPLTATAGTAACESRTNDSVAKLLECVTLEGTQAHLTALQAIADANDGTRASATRGYDLSADYVAAKLRAAGYVVTQQAFQYRTFTELTPTVLERVSPNPATLPNIVMEYSGSGDVTASTTLVSAGQDDTPGCEASDFAGFAAGSIALIRRGVCAFALKASNAAAAGAVGVVIYNNVAGSLSGTLGSAFNENLPVTGISQALGNELVAQLAGGPVTLHLAASTLRKTDTSSNVLAESRNGDPTNVVMAGAHLDSVIAGPGINDNGSGSAALLETALMLAKTKPRNLLRFAWWGAEEASLVGSTFYVNSLASAEVDRIGLYLNFDMIASPNYGLFVYDGDGSDGFSLPGPEGSADIEALLQSYYAQRGLVTRGSALNGRSDYAPFATAGIPVGGLFTGAEVAKTPEGVTLWGGVAGVAYDPCYHQACDTSDNISLSALEINTRAVAFGVVTYAMANTKVKKNAAAKSATQFEFWGPKRIR